MSSTNKNIAGRSSPSFIFLCILLLLGGLVYLNNLFSLPDSGLEKEERDLEYLALIEGVSVSEYQQKELDRKLAYRARRETSEAVRDAINLKHNNKLPELMAALEAAYGLDYEWWPQIYAEAIRADNRDAFDWFLKAKYPCEYKQRPLGWSAFEAAMSERRLDYFEELLRNDCDTRPGKNQMLLDKKLKQLKLEAWVEILYGYQPWYNYQ